MKLTCVTATFNCIKAGNRERLIRCVESVAKLKTEHEHLIFDGASTDGTVELLRELEVKIPNLKVVSEPDTGIYNALNKGVRDAKGEWFYVLGADDYICVPEVMDGLLYGNLNSDYDVIVAPVERDVLNSLYSSPSDMKWFFERHPHSHQGLIMKTSVVRRCDGFDERYKVCADYDMAFKTHEMCVNYHYTTMPFAFYSAGGFSELANGFGGSDVQQILQYHLHLCDTEYLISRKRGFYPIRKMLPFLFHSDLAFRLSSGMMVRRWGKFYLRLVLYPLVVVSRPLRRVCSCGVRCLQRRLRNREKFEK
jgi:glycosyltransferase